MSVYVYSHIDSKFSFPIAEYNRTLNLFIGECMISLISGGTWKFRAHNWIYEGNHTATALVIPEATVYDDLMRMIHNKLLVEDTQKLKLSYTCPQSQGGIPPFNVLSDADLTAYRFMNFGNKIWKTPLYCSVEPVDVKVEPSVKSETEEIEVLEVHSSAPEMEHGSQKSAGEGGSEDRKRKLAREWFSKKASKPNPVEVVNLISDDEKETEEDDVVFISSSSPDVVDLSDDEDVVFISSSSRDGRLEDSDLGLDKCDANNFGNRTTIDAGRAGSSREVEDDVEIDGDPWQDSGTAEFVKGLDYADYNALRSDHAHETVILEEDDVQSRIDTLKVGRSYDSKDSIKKLLTEYALNNCFEMVVKRSQPERLRVTCKDNNCTFTFMASVVKKTKRFMVRKFVKEHSCGMKYTHDPSKHATASFIARKILSRYDVVILVSFNTHLHDSLKGCLSTRYKGRKKALTPKEIQAAMKETGIDVTYDKAIRAKKKAEEFIRGSPEESFSYIHSWLDMLKEVNPGTYTAINTDSQNRFESCFWALGCTIRAFPHLRKVNSFS